MSNNVTFCPTCGRKSVDYKHSINKTLISGLARLNAVGGRARLDSLGLDNTIFNNFQKLQYFRLAIPTHDNCEWQITNEGIWFLQGRVQIPRYVITRNATGIRTSPEQIFITQVKDCVKYKIEWQAQAKQPGLFD